MKINGLQNVTLIDYPDKIACTIFLFGCNFRCGFCHNPELVLIEKENSKNLSEEEILKFLETRKKYLDGICITGGEPLMTLEKEFLKKIKDLGLLIKLDTNGSFPERLKEFLEEGLVDFISIDVKASKEKYFEIINKEIDLDKIEESLKLAFYSERDYEFRTTILEKFHDKEEILKMAEWLKKIFNGKIKKFVLQGFRNNGKFVDERFSAEKNTSENHLIELKKILEETEIFEKVEIR